MKRILVPTDFSQPAYNAARYAVHLARGIKANIELCHAIMVPDETPLTAQTVWPAEDYTFLKKLANSRMKDTVEELMREKKWSNHKAYQNPEISYTSEAGNVSEIVNDLVNKKDINLVVMGMAGASKMTKLFLGSNSLDIIQRAGFPVLLVPDNVVFNGLWKIAFATDLSCQDIEVIHSLSGLAREFNAEILITHVTSEKIDRQDHQQKIDSFLNEVSCKINYPKIYYRGINDKNVNQGLSWLTANSDIDMLVMVHRQHNFFSSLFKSSHTKQLARHINVPLLVYAEDTKAIKYFW